MFVTNSIALLIAMSTTSAYPMQDTDFLRSAYCYHLSLSPRMSVDLSNSDKKEGQEKFFEYLIDNNLDFPRDDKAYKDIQYKFAEWALGKFGKGVGDNKAIIDWYRANCVKRDAGEGA